MDLEEQPQVVEIPWLYRKYEGGTQIGCLDDIDYATMLEELEFK